MSRKPFIQINPRSQYIGVCWDQGYGKWNVRIMINGLRKQLGRFEDEREAALAYDREAIKLNRPTNILKPKLK